MLRNIIRNFGRVLRLHPSIAECVIHDNKYTISRKCPRLSTIRALSTNITGPQINPFDTDDYIVPYKNETETKDSGITSREELYEALQAKYRMNPLQLQKVSSADLKFRKNQIKDLDKVLDILLENVISKDSIAEYPWLLLISPRLLRNKLEVLNELKVRDINDFVPFLKLSVPRLLKLTHLMLRESSEVPGGNRVYFISDSLNLEPLFVSNHLSRRLFMLEMPFATLRQNLENMITFGIAPKNILRDLWAFRYTPKSVKCRLERAKNAKKDKIMPWMVRCPERVLVRSLKLSLEEKKLLGNCKSVVEYVAKLLNYDPETMHAIMAKHPATFRVRASKIKQILDYLLAEGYEPFEIAQVIRILCHSLNTTKKRLDELKSLGCRPSSLVIVCRSQKEYEKFVRSWVSVRNKARTAHT